MGRRRAVLQRMASNKSDMKLAACCQTCLADDGGLLGICQRLVWDHLRQLVRHIEIVARGHHVIEVKILHKGLDAQPLLLQVRAGRGMGGCASAAMLVRQQLCP